MLISQTPLRISLAGGGTDFEDYYAINGGAVLSMAIDKYVYVVIKERFDEKIYLNYSKKEIVDNVDDIHHDLIREVMKKTGISKGVEITTLADIPSEGSGLGSSSSIIVGLLNALYTYRGEQKPAEMLAREACEIEIDILGKPIGKQDQYIAAYGNLRFLGFHKDHTVCCENIDISDVEKRKLCSNLLLFYTDKVRKSETILRQQKRNIKNKLSHLNKIKALAYESKTAILNGEFDKIGGILNCNWQSKKELAENISDTEIDRLYTKALNAGALGGKIAGAGGGGFLLLYCPASRQDALRTSMSSMRELPFLLGRDGSKIIFNIRRDGLK